jgi:aldose 1-epimerase
MARFTIRHGNLGSFETVSLLDTQTEAEAVIALHGATLLHYKIFSEKGLLDVTDGFQAPEELEAGRGGRAWIMAPFSNRVNEARYTFEGATHQMTITDPVRKAILHGFVHGVDFSVLEEESDHARAKVVFFTPVLRPGAFAGYPFAIDVMVAVELHAHGLYFEITGRNVGEHNAPFGCGWHPYFRTSTAGGIDHLRLTIPAARKINTSADFLPLPGEEAYSSLDAVPEYDFRPQRPGQGNILGRRVLDTAYADLVCDKDGWVRTTLEDPETGLRIALLQQEGILHAFTGDTLAIRPRQAVALEPVQFMTNAYNRTECIPRLTLRPDETSCFRFGVEAHRL